MRTLKVAFVAWAFWIQNVEAGAIKVVMIHNAVQSNAGWKDGFFNFFVPFLNGMGGFNIMNDGESPYTMDASLCELDLKASRPNITSDIQDCISQAGDVDAIVVGSSSSNNDIKQVAESLKIPNLHCSGGNPVQWTATTPHAFGMHLPFPWYSRGPIRRAAVQGLRRILIIRDYDWGFPRTSAVAAAEWSLEASMTVIGPSLAWCRQWANMTQTCRIVNDACRCGDQAEFDALGYKYQVATMPTFYEVSESAVVEVGIDPRSEVVSPALVAFLEGIIEDVRRQGQDPDMVVNWLTSARSGLVAMRQQRLAFQMYFGGPNVPGTSWSGYESYWQNGTAALGSADALYNIGGGQWHHGMRFSDPFFSSSSEMVKQFSAQFGSPPSYDAAACMAAGISLAFSLQKYGKPLLTSPAARREEIRISIGNLNDETLFGTLRFNRFNQNNGRLSVSWQVLEDGGTEPVLPVEAASTEFRFPTPTWEVRLGCEPGLYAAALSEADRIPTQCKPCPEGTYRSLPSRGLTFSECHQCEPGTGLLPDVIGATSCTECPAGREQQSAAHRGICHRCATGMARAANSTSGRCELCPSGTYADEEGLAECKTCPLRSTQPDVGQAACICDLGSFSGHGLPDVFTSTTVSCASCEEVLPGSTTQYPGSSSPQQCMCPRGTFWHRSAANAPPWCKRCGEGLDCPGGFAEAGDPGREPLHRPPSQALGFSAGAQDFLGADPPYIIACENLARCPGALPLGHCPEGTAGKGCATCAAGRFDDGSMCAPCNELAVWPAVVCFILTVAALYLLYQYSMRVEKPHRESLMTLTISAGLAVVATQTLSAFTRMELEWIEPLKTLRAVLGILAFDIGFLRPECWIGGVDPLLEYSMAISTYPLGAGCLLLIFGFYHFVLGTHVSFNQVLNSQGLLVSAFYIALTFIALQPFQCCNNPDGTASLVAYRGITCWEDSAHTIMVALSCLPLFGVVVTYFALVSWAVWKYPTVCRGPAGVDFLKRWSFLFSRFHQQRYYFALVMTVRNLIVGLCPCLFVHLPALQLLLLNVTIAAYGFAEVHAWPWRTWISNILDGGLCLFLLLIVATGQLLLNRDEENVVVIQVFLVFLFAAATCALAFALLISLMRLAQSSRPYGIFISHHKQAAGTLARWFKIMLAERIKEKIFLDSDDVDRLETIIDITSGGTENLLVLITSETLTRIWCAAEIASAWICGTNIVLVNCDGCGVTHECIDDIPGVWTEEQRTTLNNIGIPCQTVKDAYKFLLAKPVVTLDRRGADILEHDTAAQRVLGLCCGISKNMQRICSGGTNSEDLDVIFNPMVMMIGDLQSPEPGSCCRVIQFLLQRQLEEQVHLLNPELAVLDIGKLSSVLSTAKVVLAVLTSGVLERAPFAACLTACAFSEAELIPIRADESFLYPDPPFWEKLLSGDFFKERQMIAYGTDISTVKATYTVLFNMLALKFTAHGTESIQATEVQLMCGRVLPLLSSDTQASSIQMSKSFRRNSARESKRESTRLSIRESFRLSQTLKTNSVGTGEGSQTSQALESLGVTDIEDTDVEVSF